MEEPNEGKSALILPRFVYINPRYFRNSQKIVFNKLKYRS